VNSINLGPPQDIQRMHQLVGAGQFAPALTIADKLIKSRPNDPGVLLYRSMAQRGLGQLDHAKRSLERLLEIQPRSHAAWNDLALTYQRMQRYPEALRAIDKALALVPEDPTLTATKAGLCFTRGDFEGTRAVLEPLRAKGIITAALTTAWSKIAQKFGMEREVLAMTEESLRIPNLPPVVAAGLQYQRAALLDALDEIDRAFEAYTLGNRGRGVEFDPHENRARFDRLITAWNPPMLARLPKARADGSRCVFIVGMPRSATSLIEQIIASHPKATGAGELNDLPKAVHDLRPSMTQLVPMLHEPELLTQPMLDRMAREYLATIRGVSASASRVTDKMPMNFLHLGLVRQLLPGARVIHTVRNPIDTCWSCFTQNFSGNNPFSYDLRHCGLFYRQYARLMDHWKRVLDVPMLDVVYEDLLADPERIVRAMLEFLGLPWDERCMKFHENKRVVNTASMDQVRRKLFTSSKGRWRRYEKHLGPLIEALGACARA
jgi:Sulfotransferase family/Tetratricopeptide repeat